MTVPWQDLTVQPRKADFFTNEFVAEEAWADLRAVFGDGLEAFLARTTFVMFKPDAIVRRRIPDALGFLEKNGFLPIAASPAAITRNVAHHIWRYQWNAASVDRLVLATYANEQSDALFVLLDDAAPEPVPATVRLWRLKGSVFPEHRRPNQLRTMLEVNNRMLGYVHTPDEPADIVRELGILFRQNDRLRLLERARDKVDGGVGVRSMADELHAAIPAHMLDLDEIIARNGAPVGPALAELRDCAGRGDHPRLAEIRSLFPALDSHTRRWDFITAGSLLIQHDKPGVPPLLDALAVKDVARLWDDRHPRRDAS